MRHLRAGLAILSPGVSRDDQPSGRTKWRRPRSETRSRQIAEDAAWRADWRTLPKVQRLLGAPPPLIGGTEKESKTGEPPRPSKATGADFAWLFDMLKTKSRRADARQRRSCKGATPRIGLIRGVFVVSNARLR